MLQTEPVAARYRIPILQKEKKPQELGGGNDRAHFFSFLPTRILNPKQKEALGRDDVDGYRFLWKGNLRV